MQNAGHYGPGTASQVQQQPANSQQPPQQQIQYHPVPSEQSPTGSNSSTQSLRQFRKKENVEKGSEGAPIVAQAQQQKLEARVAPHSHYPQPPASHPQTSDYRFSSPMHHPYQEYSPNSLGPGGHHQPKYDLSENHHSQNSPISTSVIQKPKNMEICQQSPGHIKQSYPHQITPSSHHQNYGLENNQLLQSPTQIHQSIYKPNEAQYYQKDQYHHQIPGHHPQKYHQMMPPQNLRKYTNPGEENFFSKQETFLGKLTKLNPSMARSIMSEHHLQESLAAGGQPPNYPAMEQRGMYQSNQRYYPGTIHHPPQMGYPSNNYPTMTYANYAPSCNYSRAPNMSAGPPNRYNPQLDRDISPSRRPYSENLHHMAMCATMSQKLPNYPHQYNPSPEYSQHYRHRRDAMGGVVPQEYYQATSGYGRPPQFMSGHQMPPGQSLQEVSESGPVALSSDNLKKFVENWMDEDELTGENTNNGTLIGEQIIQVSMVNPSDVPLLENRGIPVVTPENGHLQLTPEGIQYLIKTGIFEASNKESMVTENGTQEKVVRLHIRDPPSKGDCMLGNPLQTNKPESSKVVVQQNKVISSSSNNVSNALNAEFVDRIPNISQNLENIGVCQPNNATVSDNAKELVDKNCSPISLADYNEGLNNKDIQEARDSCIKSVESQSHGSNGSEGSRSPTGSYKSMPIIDAFDSEITSVDAKSKENTDNKATSDSSYQDLDQEAQNLVDSICSEAENSNEVHNNPGLCHQVTKMSLDSKHQISETKNVPDLNDHSSEENSLFAQKTDTCKNILSDENNSLDKTSVDLDLEKEKSLANSEESLSQAESELLRCTTPKSSTVNTPSCSPVMQEKLNFSRDSDESSVYIVPINFKRKRILSIEDIIYPKSTKENEKLSLFHQTMVFINREKQFSSLEQDNIFKIKNRVLELTEAKSKFHQDLITKSSNFEKSMSVRPAQRKRRAFSEPISKDALQTNIIDLNSQKADVSPPKKFVTVAVNTDFKFESNKQETNEPVSDTPSNEATSVLEVTSDEISLEGEKSHTNFNEISETSKVGAILDVAEKDKLKKLNQSNLDVLFNERPLCLDENPFLLSLQESNVQIKICKVDGKIIITTKHTVDKQELDINDNYDTACDSTQDNSELLSKIQNPCVNDNDQLSSITDIKNEYLFENKKPMANEGDLDNIIPDDVRETSNKIETMSDQDNQEKLPIVGECNQVKNISNNGNLKHSLLTEHPFPNLQANSQSSITSGLPENMLVNECNMTELQFDLNKQKVDNSLQKIKLVNDVFINKKKNKIIEREIDQTIGGCSENSAQPKFNLKNSENRDDLTNCNNNGEVSQDKTQSESTGHNSSEKSESESDQDEYSDLTVVDEAGTDEDNSTEAEFIKMDDTLSSEGHQSVRETEKDKNDALVTKYKKYVQYETEESVIVKKKVIFNNSTITGTKSIDLTDEDKKSKDPKNNIRKNDIRVDKESSEDDTNLHEIKKANIKVELLDLGCKDNILRDFVISKEKPDILVEQDKLISGKNPKIGKKVKSEITDDDCITDKSQKENDTDITNNSISKQLFATYISEEKAKPLDETIFSSNDVNNKSTQNIGYSEVVEEQVETAKVMTCLKKISGIDNLKASKSCENDVKVDKDNQSNFRNFSHDLEKLSHKKVNQQNSKTAINNINKNNDNSGHNENSRQSDILHSIESKDTELRENKHNYKDDLRTKNKQTIKETKIFNKKSTAVEEEQETAKVMTCLRKISRVNNLKASEYCEGGGEVDKDNQNDYKKCPDDLKTMSCNKVIQQNSEDINDLRKRNTGQNQDGRQSNISQKHKDELKNTNIILFKNVDIVNVQNQKIHQSPLLVSEETKKQIDEKECIINGCNIKNNKNIQDKSLLNSKSCPSTDKGTSESNLKINNWLDENIKNIINNDTVQSLSMNQNPIETNIPAQGTYSLHNEMSTFKLKRNAEFTPTEGCLGSIQKEQEPTKEQCFITKMADICVTQKTNDIIIYNKENLRNNTSTSTRSKFVDSTKAIVKEGASYTEVEDNSNKEIETSDYGSEIKVLKEKVRADLPKDEPLPENNLIEEPYTDETAQVDDNSNKDIETSDHVSEIKVLEEKVRADLPKNETLPENNLIEEPYTDETAQVDDNSNKDIETSDHVSETKVLEEKVRADLPKNEPLPEKNLIKEPSTESRISTDKLHCTTGNVDQIIPENKMVFDQHNSSVLKSLTLNIINTDTLAEHQKCDQIVANFKAAPLNEDKHLTLNNTNTDTNIDQQKCDHVNGDSEAPSLDDNSLKVSALDISENESSSEAEAPVLSPQVELEVFEETVLDTNTKKELTCEEDTVKITQHTTCVVFRKEDVACEVGSNINFVKDITSEVSNEVSDQAEVNLEGGEELEAINHECIEHGEIFTEKGILVLEDQQFDTLNEEEVLLDYSEDSQCDDFLEESQDTCIELSSEISDLPQDVIDCPLDSQYHEILIEDPLEVGLVEEIGRISASPDHTLEIGPLESIEVRIKATEDKCIDIQTKKEVERKLSIDRIFNNDWVVQDLAETQKPLKINLFQSSPSSFTKTHDVMILSPTSTFIEDSTLPVLKDTTVPNRRDSNECVSSIVPAPLTKAAKKQYDCDVQSTTITTTSSVREHNMSVEEPSSSKRQDRSMTHLEMREVQVYLERLNTKDIKLQLLQIQKNTANYEESITFCSNVRRIMIDAKRTKKPQNKTNIRQNRRITKSIAKNPKGFLKTTQDKFLEAKNANYSKKGLKKSNRVDQNFKQNLHKKEARKKNVKNVIQDNVLPKITDKANLKKNKTSPKSLRSKRQKTIEEDDDDFADFSELKKRHQEKKKKIQELKKNQNIQIKPVLEKLDKMKDITKQDSHPKMLFEPDHKKINAAKLKEANTKNVARPNTSNLTKSRTNSSSTIQVVKTELQMKNLVVAEPNTCKSIKPKPISSSSVKGVTPENQAKTIVNTVVSFKAKEVSHQTENEPDTSSSIKSSRPRKIRNVRKPQPTEKEEKIKEKENIEKEKFEKKEEKNTESIDETDNKNVLKHVVLPVPLVQPSDTSDDSNQNKKVLVPSVSEFSDIDKASLKRRISLQDYKKKRKIEIVNSTVETESKLKNNSLIKENGSKKLKIVEKNLKESVDLVKSLSFEETVPTSVENNTIKFETIKPRRKSVDFKSAKIYPEITVSDSNTENRDSPTSEKVTRIDPRIHFGRTSEEMVKNIQPVQSYYTRPSYFTSSAVEEEANKDKASSVKKVEHTVTEQNKLTNTDSNLKLESKPKTKQFSPKKLPQRETTEISNLISERKEKPGIKMSNELGGTKFDSTSKNKQPSPIKSPEKQFLKISNNLSDRKAKYSKKSVRKRSIDTSIYSPEAVIKPPEVSHEETNKILLRSCNEWEDSMSPKQQTSNDDHVGITFSGIINKNSKPIIDVDELKLTIDPSYNAAPEEKGNLKQNTSIEEYKERIDSELSSISINIPRPKREYFNTMAENRGKIIEEVPKFNIEDIKQPLESNELIQKYLKDPESITEVEKEIILKIISYKRLMDENQKNSDNLSVLSGNSQRYEIKESGNDRMKLHFKRLGYNKRKLSLQSPERNREDQKRIDVDSPETNWEDRVPKTFNQYANDNRKRIVEAQKEKKCYREDNTYFRSESSDIFDQRLNEYEDEPACSKSWNEPQSRINDYSVQYGSPTKKGKVPKIIFKRTKDRKTSEESVMELEKTEPNTFKGKHYFNLNEDD